MGCGWSLTFSFVCADADSKVNYFELANNLRTLKVSTLAPVAIAGAVLHSMLQTRTMQGHCVTACHWSTPVEMLCAYCAAHGSQLSAVLLMKFVGAVNFTGSLKG